MKLSTTRHEVGGGAARFATTPAHTLLIAALAQLSRDITQKAFTDRLGSALRDSSHGWQSRELQFTPIPHEAAGRPRAIDYFHRPSRTAIELELGNQTVFSHDLLKLEVAFRNGLSDAGVILTATAETRRVLDWNPRNAYLTHENAGLFQRIFGPALTVPLAVLGLEV